MATARNGDDLAGGHDTWVQQLEADTGLTADDLWNIASDRDAWRALRPIAGQADQ